MNRAPDVQHILQSDPYHTLKLACRSDTHTHTHTHTHAHRHKYPLWVWAKVTWSVAIDLEV